MCEGGKMRNRRPGLVLHSYRLSFVGGYLVQIFVVFHVLDSREACKLVSYGSW